MYLAEAFQIISSSVLKILNSQEIKITYIYIKRLKTHGGIFT